MSSKGSDASIARLMRDFPLSFCDPPKPLRIGTFESIFARLRPHLARDDFAQHMAWAWRYTRQGRAISAALEVWTTQPAYLATLPVSLL
ncbi:hypothetical protein [Bradyrhizobium sp. CB1015]|uniref:hypothetical protein n=1 Tax=Bradyrhizobium sp. CB1015 TaxID=2976822 RepID=UPI0021AA1689|nr:hypothetical protein [Bradyrhizobium sp. CB1015]UWU94394.1 hypothetical protein N2604_11380 [Bradyrhizobium sp. CB1015]